MPYVPPYQPASAGNPSASPGIGDVRPSRSNATVTPQARDLKSAPPPATTDSALASLGDGVTNGRGAPALSVPEMSLSPDDLLDLLRSIQAKSNDVQMQTAKTGIESTKLKIDQNNADQLAKLKEWSDKAKEAESQGHLGKIFGWIGKIVAVVAALGALAVALTSAVASGGLATPLVLFAAMALIAATVSLADQVSQELGGGPISLGNLFSSASTKLLEAFGVDEVTAEKIGKVMAGVAAVAMPVMLLVEPQIIGTMAAGICELAGADPNTTAIVSMVVGLAAAITVGVLACVATCGGSAAQSATEMVGGLINSGAALAGGLSDVAQGATGIVVAKTMAKSDAALAAKKELDAAMAKLQGVMEQNREDLKKIMQEIQDGITAVSQIINGSVDSMAQITANIGRRVTV